MRPISEDLIHLAVTQLYCFKLWEVHFTLGSIL